MVAIHTLKAALESLRETPAARLSSGLEVQGCCSRLRALTGALSLPGRAALGLFQDKPSSLQRKSSRAESRRSNSRLE